MKMKIVFFIFTVLLFTSAYAANCSDNPCELSGYFGPHNGYRCLDFNGDAICTGPGTGYEVNQPFRLCNRSSPINNACRRTSQLIECLESNDCGTSFVCLCESPTGGTPYVTTNADCIPQTPPLSCPNIIGPGITPPSPCLHGGVYVNNVCHCPSGYSGIHCQDKNDYNLCDRVICKNNGVCAVQKPNGPYEGVCLCRYGTWGEYCEMSGTLGFCSPGLCMNNGACRENVVGTTRFAYCQCQPGYSGAKCEQCNFACTTTGLFPDKIMHEQGKYFECVSVSGPLRLEQRSCPRGLRFNETSKLCTL